MRKTLTIRLSGKTKRLVERAACESGVSTSEYVRLAIERQLWLDTVAKSRQAAVRRARAKRILTDQDVFQLIS